MKKVISVIAAAAMMCAAVSPVFAENTESASPDVFINGTKIFFSDQGVVVKDNRVLVPLRGVFEAMGAKVSWDQEKQQAQVESADNNTWVRLIIGDKNMKVYDMSGFFATLVSGQDFVAPETIIELDVAPEAMNNRTLVPLRAISEAIDADVVWDEESYSVQITSKDAPTNEKADGKPAYTLSAGAETVNEGETVDIYINAENIKENTYVGGMRAAVTFNQENFEFEDADFLGADGSEIGLKDASVINGNIASAIAIATDSDTTVKSDGKVMKLTFKSLNGKSGDFALVNGYSNNGAMTYLQLNSMDETETEPMKLYKGNDFYIDTTPVTINSGK